MRGSVLCLSIAISSAGCAQPWVPQGSPQGVGRASCDSLEIEKSLIQLKNPQEQMNWISGFLESCADELPKRKRSSLYELYNSLFIQYRYQDTRAYEAFRWYDTDGRLIRGELFLKRDPKTSEVLHRPFVVFQCGMGCDLGDPSMRLAIMVLYDESPFHLLALPSSTSLSFQQDNKILEFGGVLEGEKLMGVVDYLRSPLFPHRDAVGSIHLVGISLGGQGVLFAALYDNAQRPKVASFHAGCPVVDLEGSLVELMRPTTVGNAFAGKVLSTARTLVHSIPFFGNLLQELEHLKAHERAKRLVESSAVWGFRQSSRSSRALSILRSSNLPTRELTLPDEEKIQKSEREFWKLHQFQQFASYVERPLYIWAAQDDEVVKSQVNTELLVPHKSASTAVFYGERGNHCLFYESMGWRRFGSLWRSVVISQSPELRDFARYTRVRLHDYRWPQGFRSEAATRRHSLKWIAEPGRTEISLETRGLRPCGRGFDKGHSVSEYCQYRRSVPVSLEALGLVREQIPVSEPEAQALTRYLNANVRIFDDSGNELQSHKAPRFLVWLNF